MKIDKLNNFDLIRLFAAIQVLVWHAFVHLDLFQADSLLLKILFNFPGVPIFFAVSGFLITSSIDKPGFKIANYVRNRFLRIFPALFICLLFTLVLMVSSGVSVKMSDWFIYLLTNLTIFQSWSPEGLRMWGVGHPNGSLWSISIEIQLYILLPFLIILLNKQTITFKNRVLLLLFIISIVYRIVVDIYPDGESMRIRQLGSMFLLYHFHFFVFGIALYYNFNRLLSYLEGRMFLWLAVYITYFLVFKYYLHTYESPYSYSLFGIIANILLVFFVFSCSFSNKTWSLTLLGNRDFSYGLYIFHMPVINFLVHYGLVGQMVYFYLVCLVSFILAVLSWTLIERKALQFK